MHDTVISPISKCQASSELGKTKTINFTDDKH